MQQRGLHELHRELSRRDLLRLAGLGLSGLGLAAIVGCGSDDGNGGPATTPAVVADPPPETTTIRLGRNVVAPRMAPFYLAEQFLMEEGFTNVQYIDVAPGSGGTGGSFQQIASGEMDITLHFAQSVTVAADAGDPILLLAGVHNSMLVLFGNERVQSLRDLKGKRFAGSRDANDPRYAFIAALLAYIGIDVEHDVEFVDVDISGLLSGAQTGDIDAWAVTRPLSTAFRNANIGHVLLDGAVDPPWSQYFGAMATANRDFVEQHPAATKRALRAILKATDVCAEEPERAARYLVDKGFTTYTYDQVLDIITGVSFAAWREFDPEDTMRFYALRLREAGLVKSTPDELIARATDWRYLDEIKRELGVA
ncbi:MAG: ABC transporter substrate-binding protein [Dehalococcoidia bacterium]